MSRETDWRSLVVQADPEHTRASRFVIEYEFSAPGRGNDRIHEGGFRVFRGDYSTRGPYAPETIVAGGITFNGIPITFNGIPLTFDED